ncbi:hypothetical protein O9929_25450 [Vibrio lentus]|nr:hypothetical protein [Vibrio lentus]
MSSIQVNWFISVSTIKLCVAMSSIQVRFRLLPYSRRVKRATSGHCLRPGEEIPYLGCGSEARATRGFNKITSALL